MTESDRSLAPPAWVCRPPVGRGAALALWGAARDDEIALSARPQATIDITATPVDTFIERFHPSLQRSIHVIGTE